MAISLGVYSDSGLTTPLTSVQAVQADDGTAAPADRVIYIGSQVAGKVFQAASNPGVDQIALSIADAAPGSGVEASHVKLALSQATLTSAVAGAARNLGTQLSSGPGNALKVYVRVDTPALAIGTYTGITLQTNMLIEVSA